MEDLFTLASLISLVTLTVMEIVLGIDNVIFVSIIMGRLPKEDQKKARQIWMVAGISVRCVMLLLLGWLVQNGNTELFSILGYGFSLRNLIMLAGGLFLLVKTVSEIHNKLEGEEYHSTAESVKKASFGAIMSQIILVDLVFSFDSMITAVGLAKHVEIMMVAVIIAMVVMFVFAERISNFIHQHPTLKMLALSFLVLVGFMLFFEGLESMHHSHIDKGYLYFAMAFAFGVEMLNMNMRRKNKPIELREPVAQDVLK